MNKAKILEYITDLENKNELLQDNIYKLQDRIDKAIYYIELDMYGTALDILKGDNK